MRSHFSITFGQLIKVPLRSSLVESLELSNCYSKFIISRMDWKKKHSQISTKSTITLQLPFQFYVRPWYRRSCSKSESNFDIFHSSQNIISKKLNNIDLGLENLNSWNFFTWYPWFHTYWSFNSSVISCQKLDLRVHPLPPYRNK